MRYVLYTGYVSDTRIKPHSRTIVSRLFNRVVMEDQELSWSKAHDTRRSLGGHSAPLTYVWTHSRDADCDATIASPRDPTSRCEVRKRGPQTIGRYCRRTCGRRLEIRLAVNAGVSRCTFACWRPASGCYRRCIDSIPTGKPSRTLRGSTRVGGRAGRNEPDVGQVGR